LALTVPRYYFFPATVLYTTWGLLHAMILGLWERLPERDPLLDMEIDDSGVELREVDYSDLAPGPFTRKGRPRRRKWKPTGEGEGGGGAEGPEKPV
jgi:hypothetical protein